MFAVEFLQNATFLMLAEKNLTLFVQNMGLCKVQPKKICHFGKAATAKNNAQDSYKRGDRKRLHSKVRCLMKYNCATSVRVKEEHCDNWCNNVLV